MNSRFFSLLLAIVDAVLMSHSEAPKPGLYPLIPLIGDLMFLLIPVGLIWYCDIAGNFTGPMSRGGYVDVETPGWLVAGFGWLVLLGIFIYHVFVAGPVLMPNR